jgi:AcrR family transcriptional regulator
MNTHSEDTRKRILDTAQGLFSKNGYNATGVAQICSAAGVSKGAFYHHYDSKQALFLAILDHWLKELNAGFQNAQHNIENIPEAIQDMAFAAGSIFQSADVRTTILLEFWTQASRDPQIWKAAIDPFLRYLAYFSQLFKEGIHQGTIKNIDPDRGARVLISLAMGLLMQSFFTSERIDWAEETRQSVKLLFDGISRSSL